MRLLLHTLRIALVLATITNTTSAQWVQQNTPSMKGLYTMQAIGKNTMWTRNINLGGLDTAFNPQFIRTGDGGKTYKLGQLDRDYLNDEIRAVDGKTAYLIAGSISSPNYYFRRTVDSGATWQDMPFHPTTFPDFVHFYDVNNGIYLGDPDSLGFYVAFTTNGGNTFTRIPQSNLPRPEEGEFCNSGIYQVLGDNIFLENYLFNPQTGDIKWRIMRSIDRGRNWTSGEWFNRGEQFEARYCFTDANNGMVHRGIGTLDMGSPLYTTDGGATWKESGKYPGLVSFPIDAIPNTQTIMAIFQDTVRGVTFTAATNDFGKTWNSRKDIGTSILDRRYADILGIDYYINGQLKIVDNNTAWAQFSNNAIHRYDNATPLVPEKPDLELTLTADNDGLPLWGYVKFTLTMRNRGISKATGIKANWLPPYKRTSTGGEAFANVGAYASKGNYNWWTGDWNVNELAGGETATATFHLFVVKNTANVSQTAQITACNELDLDSSPNNMTATSNEDDEARFTSIGRPSNIVDPNLSSNFSISTLKVSPNPAKDKAFVVVNDKTEAEWTVKIVNNTGQVVYTQTGQNSQLVEVNTEGLPNGLYFVEFKNGLEKKIEKLMVQH